MDHFTSYAAAGNACLAEQERIEREGERNDELDRLAAEQARLTVNDDRVTPEMTIAVLWAMDGSLEERDVLVACLAHFDTLYEMAALFGTAAETQAARAIQCALDEFRAKVIKSETLRIRPGMEIAS